MTDETAVLRDVMWIDQDMCLRFPNDSPLIEEQHCSVECVGGNSPWDFCTSPSSSPKLCDTPVSIISAVSSAGDQDDCLVETQNRQDFPTSTSTSRSFSGTPRTWQHELTGSLSSWDNERQPQPHACSQCEHPFDSMQDIVDHAKRSSHKAWKCLEPECDKAYSRRDTFLRHRTAHKIKSHPCKLCSKDRKQKSFKRKDHLKAHIRKCHSDKGDKDLPSFQELVDRNVHEQTDTPIKCDTDTQQQRAVQTLAENMGAVLGDQHPTFNIGDFSGKMTALSDSDMKSVVGSMASVAATMAQTILSATAGINGVNDERRTLL